MRAMLCLSLAFISTAAFADDDCPYNPVTGLIECPQFTGGPGSWGGWLNDQQDFAKLINQPALASRTLQLPAHLTSKDKEVVRELLEDRRKNLEEIRIWAEEKKKENPNTIEYKKAIDFYDLGISNYKSSIELVK